MGICRVQCRSCFNGVTFKVNFDLVSLMKLSPKMRGCVNDDTTIAGVVHTFRSKSMSTWTVASVVNVSPAAPRSL